MRDLRVETLQGSIYLEETPGDDPAIVLMHGFPDDHRIYQKLIPLLGPRRVVAFDWMGYGKSDRSDQSQLTSEDHAAELGAVLDKLGIERAVLVAHDASGPDSVAYAVDHQDRIAAVILLNTYFGHQASLQFPEMIRLFADPGLKPLADAMANDQNQRLWLLWHTAAQFGLEPGDPGGVGAISVVPQFFGDAEQPDALAAIRSWTAALFDTLGLQDAMIDSGALSDLRIPVTVIFGGRDRYLSPDVGAELSSLFKSSSIHVLDDASHWPQWDEPQVVAGLILAIATDDNP
jgi:pimeloyl-ACP methyl ester carboxylesterase